MAIENICGNLRDAYKQCAQGTMLHSYELMQERRMNQIRDDHFSYAADGYIYCIEEGIPVLYVCSEMTADGKQILNPILKHIDDAFATLTVKSRLGEYRVVADDVEAVKSDARTARIELNELRLMGRGGLMGQGELIIPTAAPGSTTRGYDDLTLHERTFAERMYGGCEDDFIANMKMFNDAGVAEARIYVLDPTYVAKHADEGAIARASWLADSRSSFVSACVRYIDCGYGVRGLRKEKGI